MINWAAFSRPMPPPAGPPPPVDYSQMIDRNFEELQNELQRNRENSRADEQMQLNERHQNTADRRQAEYQDLQNRMEERRGREMDRAHADQRRQELYHLLTLYQNAKTPQEAANASQMLSALGYPVRSLQKMETPTAPVAQAPSQAPVQPQQSTPQGAPPGAEGEWQKGYMAGAPPPKAPEDQADYETIGKEYMRGTGPARREKKPEDAKTAAELDALQSDVTGKLLPGQPMQYGWGTRDDAPLLPGQTPVISRSATDLPEAGYLSEGDSLLQR